MELRGGVKLYWHCAISLTQLDKTSTATLNVFAEAGTDWLFCININSLSCVVGE